MPARQDVSEVVEWPQDVQLTCARQLGSCALLLPKRAPCTEPCLPLQLMELGDLGQAIQRDPETWGWHGK